MHGSLRSSPGLSRVRLLQRTPGADCYRRSLITEERDESSRLFWFMRIAVDVMGGDHGCEVVIEGVKQALAADRAISSIFLVGNEAEIRSARQKLQLEDSRVETVH